MNEIVVAGIGPGAYEKMTIEVEKALQTCDVIVGYTTYIELIQEYFPGKEYLTTPMTKEKERCMMCFLEAAKGKRVVMICSGDAGVYGMAGLMYEVRESFLAGAKEGEEVATIRILPGVTAACAGGALLGAPLMHDYATISLSDRLTPWEKIEKRLLYAAESDMAIVLYNPSSKGRADYLERACELLLQVLPKGQICGYAKRIGRDGEQTYVCSLQELSTLSVDMFTTVFIGNQQTKKLQDKMVTPRGYRID